MYHTALKWRKKVYTVIIRTRESIGDSLTQKKKKMTDTFMAIPENLKLKKIQPVNPKNWKRKL